MPSISPLNIIAMSIIVSLCLVAQSASGKFNPRGTAGVGMSKFRSDSSKNKAKSAQLAVEDRYNVSSTTRVLDHAPRATARARRTRDLNKTRSANAHKAPLKRNMSMATRGSNVVLAGETQQRKPTPTKRRRQNQEPTPEPTGDPSSATTVYVDDTNAFALLLPRNPGETVSDAEDDSIAYCTDGSGCENPFPEGFITGAAYSAAPDGSYVQITGCMDSSQFPFASDDDGGQYDDRFPNGAQCTFGGYGASFIELVEPSANRFCLRCCRDADDQENCNSHQDRAGCPVAIPGTYEFGGVGCS